MIVLTKNVLEILPIIERLTYPDCGAVVTFLGVTRNHHQGKKVKYLSYEAHESFAIKELEKIRQKMLEKYKIKEMAILHRLGEVKIQEASLLLVVASHHRKPALQAIEEAIDRLKKDVPIWKKEFYEDGENRWIEPKVL